MRIPSSSGARSGAWHSSHSTANVDENGASQAGQRRSILPPQAHVSGISSSLSTNQRRAAPQSRQNADQWPSTLRRSSRSQSAALPTDRTVVRRRYGTAGSVAVVIAGSVTTAVDVAELVGDVVVEGAVVPADGRG
jgi:hypothetical protein